MQAWGLSSVVIETFGMELVEAEREGRIILLYHTIAVAVVAIETYLITETVAMPKRRQAQINATITTGYLTTLFFGLGFGYFGHNPTLHGLYLAGLSLTFFAGVQLAIALWPGRARDRSRASDPAYARWGSVDLERVAFFVTAIATLGSAALGGIAGAAWGSGHETFLAEDIVRHAEKTTLQRAVIGHLHIMLTLIAIALALLVGRWLDFKGFWHKLAMPLFVTGTTVITLGAWAVVPYEEIAHTIIYGGSTLVLLGALFLVIFGFDQLIRRGIAARGIKKPTLGDKLRALVQDPLKFGALWQMVFMNFVVSGPGIFMAVNLDEIFRVWPMRDERLVLTGHWHVLSGLIATIILLYYADMAGLKGRLRQLFGWTVILFSDLAFAAATIFATKRLFVSELDEGPLVRTTTLLIDLGLGAVLLALGALMVWRLVDLFKKKGRWRHELAAHSGYREGRAAR
jgi:hypothetical protein